MSKYEVIENYQDIYYPEKFRDEKPKKPGMQYYTCVLLRKDTISVDKTLNHSIYIRTVSSLYLFFAFLNWSKQFDKPFW